MVVLHGEVDYLSDGETVVEVRNGHARLAEITGTGCSLGSVIGVYVGALADSASSERGYTLRDVLAAALAG